MDRAPLRRGSRAASRPRFELDSLPVNPAFSGSLASVDGAIMLASAATIPATDEGLLRGDGAFEVIRIYDGHPFAFEDHLQ